jgi:predicted phage tail component-like protein
LLSIKFNNKDSYKDLELVVVGTITRPSTNSNYETITIPGRRGSLNIFQNYNDNEITITFGFKNLENFTRKKSNILAWINDKKCKELIISDDETIFYNVNKVSVSGLDGNNIKNFKCTFTIEPFTFFNEGKEMKEINEATVLYNEKANKESELYMKIYGTGDITININNQVLILKGINEFVEVDSKLKNCYKNINGVITNCNNQMYSPFPTLEVGENIINWTGAVTKIEIIPRWCCQ